MKQNNTPEADFNFLRYANCWEDARLLIAALNPAPGKHILSIASAGDNSLALLASGARVTAVDLNPAQLACTALKKEAIRILEHKDYLKFVGVLPVDDRQQTYAMIRVKLDSQSQAFWDAHPAAINQGFIHTGKFEHYFHLFRRKVLPLIHREPVVRGLLETKSREERVRFYNDVWNNRRWRLLFNLFFSRKVMGLLGRDPAFFKHVKGNVSKRILQRAAYALTELDTSDNPYLTYILTGNFQHSLPYYLIPENYLNIQNHVDNLVLKQGTIDVVARDYGDDYFDGYNLSDIFEYLTKPQCKAVYGSLIKSAKPHARIAYWNMLVSRQCPVELEKYVISLEQQADELFLRDQAFFYSRFVLEEAK